MVLNVEGVRLAKRDGAVTLRKLHALGWSPQDVVELLGRSLGIEGARSAEDFARGLQIEMLHRKPWLINPQELTKGPGYLNVRG